MNVVQQNMSKQQKVPSGHEVEEFSNFTFLGIEAHFQVLKTIEFMHNL